MALPTTICERWIQVKEVQVRLRFVVAQRHDGKFVIRTDGLMHRGRPELEIVDVPSGRLDEARRLLSRVAERTAERPVLAGKLLELDDGAVVRIEEGTHLQAGRFARGLGPAERTVYRVAM